MKKLIILLFILLISNICYCQDNIAKDILDNLRQKTESYLKQQVSYNYSSKPT